MKTFNGSRHNETRLVFRLFQIIAAVGLFLSVAMLASEPPLGAKIGQMVYISWFAIAVISIEAILQKLKVGVYALVFATITVTVVDLMIGKATLGGASLGLLVGYVLIVYIRPDWWQFD